MQNEQGQAIADHWSKGDVYGLILSALEKAGKSPVSLSIQDLAPVDHSMREDFPPRSILPTGYPSNQTTTSWTSGAASADRPRYFASRFRCRVTGIDMTPAFVDAARKLTALLDLERRRPVSALCRWRLRRCLRAARHN
jgi:hypothetical protein